MAIINLKPLSKRDPIFKGSFMTFSKSKKGEKMNEKEKQLKLDKNKVKWFSGNSKKKLLFLESIGNHKTPRDVMLKNLIKVLEKNGFVITNKK